MCLIKWRFPIPFFIKWLFCSLYRGPDFLLPWKLLLHCSLLCLGIFSLPEAVFHFSYVTPRPGAPPSPAYPYPHDSLQALSLGLTAKPAAAKTFFGSFLFQLLEASYKAVTLYRINDCVHYCTSLSNSAMLAVCTTLVLGLSIRNFLLLLLSLLQS